MCVGIILYLCLHSTSLPKFCHLHWYFARRSSPTLELSKNFHLAGFVDSKSAGCSATKLTKFELQTMFERCFENVGKYSMKSSAMKFLFSKLQAFKLWPLAFCVLKITEIPQIASTMKLFFSVADANRFSTG